MKKIGKIIPDIVIRSYTNNYNIFQFNEADVLIKQGIIAVQKNISSIYNRLLLNIL